LWYPRELENMAYDPDFFVRGLHFDFSTNILLKMDAFCNIQKGTAHRGKKILSEDDINSIYNGHHIPQHYLKFSSLESKRMGQLLDLFSLPEIGLLSNVIEYFENNSIPYNSLSILHDVRTATGQIHSTGEMHHAILKNTVIQECDIYWEKIGKSCSTVS
ncbi:5'-nucleotidase domain-containing protein 3, partial [Trichinella pseudospiralis]